MDFPTPIPFVDLLGFKLVYMRDGTSRLTYDPEEAHLNSFQVTHGGASMTLLSRWRTLLVASTRRWAS